MWLLSHLRKARRLILESYHKKPLVSGQSSKDGTIEGIGRKNKTLLVEGRAVRSGGGREQR